jgi:hypothetical protein
MKIIFSRKGFDSQYGGIPSPIFPDGTFVSFPIPQSQDINCLGDINLPISASVDDLIKNLSKNRLSAETRIHLDPALAPTRNETTDDWRPVLGQTGASQSHLDKQNVGHGDVFLFYGWFRHVEEKNGIWRYKPGTPDLHMIFGWLEVDFLLSIVTQRENSIKKHPWIKNHPHVANPDHYTDKRNTLYVGADQSSFADRPMKGGGFFKSVSENIILTKPGASRSVWSLPLWIRPEKGKAPLTYHTSAERWTRYDDHMQLKTVAKGQEFVIDVNDYPEAMPWLVKTIRNNQ